MEVCAKDSLAWLVISSECHKICLSFSSPVCDWWHNCTREEDRIRLSFRQRQRTWTSSWIRNKTRTWTWTWAEGASVMARSYYYYGAPDCRSIDPPTRLHCTVNAPINPLTEGGVCFPLFFLDWKELAGKWSLLKMQFQLGMVDYPGFGYLLIVQFLQVIKQS